VKTVELDDGTVEQLASIGLDIVLKSYMSRLKDMAVDAGEEWDEGLNQEEELPLKYVDFGNGFREVQHIMGER